MTVDESPEDRLRISLRDEAGSESVGRVEISEETIQKFSDDGFISFPNVLSLDDVDALNDRLEKILRGEYDRNQEPDKTPKLIKSNYETGQFSINSSVKGKIENDMASQQPSKQLENSGSTPNARKTKGGARGPLGFSGNLQNVKVLQVINVHKADHLFRKLATSNLLGETVAKLAGWKQGARLAQDQIWAKPPGASPLVFHRDSPYFMFDPPDVVTVWVALDTMDEELGPLEYVKGSHLWGDARVGSANQFFQANGGLKLVRSAAQKQGIAMEDLEIISMAGLQAGGISIHDGRTWHGSGKNNSHDRPRRGLGLHFVPAEVKFTAEASNSKLWKSYIENVEDAKTAEIPEEDFPLTWQPT